MPPTFRKGRAILLCFVFAVLLMGISLFNGYPMYDGDTHSYLDAGFKGMFQVDRTPYYGYFIRLSSFWSSLWYTVFFQCFVLACLLSRYIALLCGARPGLLFSLACFIAITSLTCVSWVCATLMPDVFGGILLLTTLLFFFDRAAPFWLQGIYLLVIFVALSMHNSHFLITVLFAMSIFVYSLLLKHRDWLRKSLLLFSVAAGFFLFYCSVNLSNGYGFTFSPSASVFTMAKMASTGVLDAYLNDHCEKDHLRLCRCKGQFSPYQWAFVWPAPYDPVSKLGIPDSCSEEIKTILHNMVTTPKYLGLIVKKSMMSGLQQFFDVQVGIPTVSVNAWQQERFRTYFEDEYQEFSISKENTGKLDPHDFNMIYNLVYVLSAIWVLLLLQKQPDREVFRIYACMILFFLLNALVLASFSAILYRYQYRVSWLLPATNLILILHYLKNRFSGSTH